MSSSSSQQPRCLNRKCSINTLGPTSPELEPVFCSILHQMREICTKELEAELEVERQETLQNKSSRSKSKSKKTSTSTTKSTNPADTDYINFGTCWNGGTIVTHTGLETLAEARKYVKSLTSYDQELWVKGIVADRDSRRAYRLGDFNGTDNLNAWATQVQSCMGLPKIKNMYTDQSPRYNYPQSSITAAPSGSSQPAYTVVTSSYDTPSSSGPQQTAFGYSGDWEQYQED